MDRLSKFVNITYDDRGRRQFHLKEKAAKAQTPAAAKPQAPVIDYSKPLQAREDDTDFAVKLGRRKLPVDEDVAKSAPFRCETCDFAVMDSNSWLDHLNSPSHNRMIGNHMKVERVSVGRVRERIRMLKSKQKAKSDPKSAERETNDLPGDSEGPSKRPKLGSDSLR